MEEIEYSLILDLFELGSWIIHVNKSHCPRTISTIENILPIRSRGLKRSGKFIINTDFTTQAENQKKSFDFGEISVDTSSGNLTIYLEKCDLDKPENLLGYIVNLEKINSVKLTQGLEIRLNL